MDSPLRVALLGAGWIAEHAYLPALVETPSLVLTEVCDPVVDRARRLAEAVSTARPSTDPSLAIAAVDAVLICAPVGAHLALLSAALGAGKFVFCEKPVLRARAEIDALRTTSPLDRLMGSAAMRLREDVVDWLRWIRSGGIGRLRRLRLTWHRQQGVPVPGSWRTAASQSPAGVLEDLGPHLLDIAVGALDAAGLEPLERMRLRQVELRNHSEGAAGQGASWFENASASYDAPDRCSAVAAIADDCELELSVRWTDPEHGDVVRLEAQGSEGKAELQGLFGYSTARRCLEQTCSLSTRAENIRQVYVAGPAQQQRAFATVLQRFSTFCSGKVEPLASARDIGLVAGWLEDLRGAAAEGATA